MERTVFNAAQLQILDLMSYVESEDTLNEIKDMLSNYFAQKAVIDQWKQEHLRTPYNSAR